MELLQGFVSKLETSTGMKGPESTLLFLDDYLDFVAHQVSPRLLFAVFLQYLIAVFRPNGRGTNENSATTLSPDLLK